MKPTMQSAASKRQQSLGISWWYQNWSSKVRTEKKKILTMRQEMHRWAVANVGGPKLKTLKDTKAVGPRVPEANQSWRRTPVVLPYVIQSRSMDDVEVRHDGAVHSRLETGSSC